MWPITSLFLWMFLLVGVHGGANRASVSRTHSGPSIIHWAIRVLLRAGVPVSAAAPLRLLTVRGRKTGQARTVAVDFHERDRRHFLIATHGEVNWVRNLRAAGEGSLSLGRSHQTFTATELPPEAGGPVIKDALGPLLESSGMLGSLVHSYWNMGVTAGSSEADYITVARSHPVFELDFRRQDHIAPRANGG